MDHGRRAWTAFDGGEDALIVARLRGAGAIVVAKSTTPEFAHSSLTGSPRYGTTRNPWDPSRTCGGSSGGSAVAVATGVAPFAEGTDMGGSVRIPAGACGAVGFKPGLGRIPMTILPTPIDTLSHFGPLAASVADAVAFVAATAGASDLDLLSQVHPFDTRACAPVPLAGLRLAYSPDLGYCAVSDAVRERIENAVERLRAAGASVTEIRLPWTADVLATWLARWGVLLALLPYGRARAARARMDPALVRLIEDGERRGALELKRTECRQAAMARDLAAVMCEHDALLCPTNALEAPPVAACDADFEGTDARGRLRTFDMAHAFNLLPSYPVASVPAGLTAAGLPVGLQIVGPRYRDERLLAIAGGVEGVLGRLAPRPPPYASPRSPPRAGGADRPACATILPDSHPERRVRIVNLSRGRPAGEVRPGPAVRQASSLQEPCRLIDAIAPTKIPSATGANGLMPTSASANSDPTIRPRTAPTAANVRMSRAAFDQFIASHLQLSRGRVRTRP